VLPDPAGDREDLKGRLRVLRTGWAERPGLLARPDGIVAWAGEEATLDTALRTWFGE
jgi:hypothetical protein